MNEIGDLILTDAIGGFGTPKRYRSRSAREALRNRSWNFWDFENGLQGTPFQAYTNNSAAVTPAIESPGRSIVRLMTQGAAGTKCAIHTNLSPTVPGGSLYYCTMGAFTFETSIHVNALATVSEDFRLRVGLQNRADDAATAMICFEYDRGVNINWVGRTASGGSSSTSNLGVAVEATNYHVLRFEVNAAGTSVQFYIDDVAVGSPITTNLPSTALVPTGLVISVNTDVSAGSAQRFFSVDWVAYDLRFATAR
jgi:hypothetical protein